MRAGSRDWRWPAREGAADARRQSDKPRWRRPGPRKAEVMQRTLSTATARDRPTGQALAHLTNRIVGVYKGALGRGPTRARADFVGDDLLVCRLDDTLTHVEAYLVEHGAEPVILELRQAFRSAVGGQLERQVEKITGREVRSTRTEFDPRSGTATELFWIDTGQRAKRRDTSPLSP